MKKTKLIALVVAGSLILGLAGCSAYRGRDRGKDKDRKKTEEEEDEEEGVYEKDFGTYVIENEDWVEVEEHSDPPYYFSYCVEGNEDEAMPNNIAVFYDENDYSEDEHEDFRDGILASLGAQAQGLEGVTITSAGTTSANDIIVYRFELQSSENLTVQWYLVGDEEYVMVSACIWDEDEASEDGIMEVAQGIVDSFEW